MMNTTTVHCKKNPYDIYIGRPSKWGNPFTHIKDKNTLAEFIVPDRETAVKSYREWITNGSGKHLLNDLHQLHGKVLGCWCKPLSCHGDILSELINNLTTTLKGKYYRTYINPSANNLKLYVYDVPDSDEDNFKFIGNYQSEEINTIVTKFELQKLPIYLQNQIDNHI